MDDLDSDGRPGITEPLPSESTAPEVYALHGVARLLVDQGHNEGSGVGGFTGFLASQGWSIGTIPTRPITAETLAACDVLLIPSGLGLSIVPFSSEEVGAISNFVASGKGLWLFNEYNTIPAGINSLASQFGVQFAFSTLQDSTDNEGELVWPRIHVLDSHPVFQGVTAYGLYGGCSLSAITPSTVIASGDDDSFCPPSASPPCPPFPGTMAAFESTGRIICAGDMTPLHPGWYPEQLREEEERLLQSIANWLAHLEPTSVEAGSWGHIKSLFR